MTDKHPYGTTLLARDTPENRKVWKTEEIGVIPVDPNVCTADHQCPYYRDGASAETEEDSTTPIHMLIASYRDQLCPRTLHNIFHRAVHSDRITVRILLQNDPTSDLIDDADCWERYCQDYNTDCSTFKHQVHTVRINSSDAKGPTDARSKLSAMIHYDYTHADQATAPVDAHDFCMQTDSHMDFSDHWDTQMIQMWHRCQNEYAVLSTYVADISQNNQDPKTVPNLCMVVFTESIRNWGTKECTSLTRPKLTNMWGAGLSFHKCHAELNVPVDPYTDQVFDGEEGSRAIRFFTHGYDVYTPDKVLVTHDYDKHQSNPVVHTWGRKKKKEIVNEHSWPWLEEIVHERSNVKTLGAKRINMIVGIGKFKITEQEEIQTARASRYGVGTKRTLEQAASFTGIDFENRKMVANKCGNLKWVPYEESPNFGLDGILSRPLVPNLEEARDIMSGALEQRILLASSSSDVVHVSVGLSVLALIAVVARKRLFGKKKNARHTA